MKHLICKATYFVVMVLLILCIYACSDTDKIVSPKPLGILTGVVNDEEGGALGGVSITLKQTTQGKETKSDGSYEFTDLEEGWYDIMATKTGYLDASVQVQLTQTTQTVPPIVLKKAVGDIRGTVKPQIEGAYVVLFSENSGKQYRVTDQSGDFIFENLPIGNYELSIYAVDYIKKDGISAKVPSSANTYTLDPYEGMITVSVPYIDLGAITANNIAAFSVNTKGSTDLEWVIINDNPGWIKSIEPKKGKGDKVIIVEIDRNKIDSSRENNYATITVVSATDGSSDKLLLTVTETGNGMNLADLTIQEEKITLTSTTATIPCRILNPDIINTCEIVMLYSASANYPEESNSSMGSGVIEGMDFVSELRDLKPNTQYWARAYAYNKQNREERYWSNNTISFTTESSEPKVQTNPVTEITETTAKFHGEIIHAGEPEYTECGFVYSERVDPTLENTIKKLSVLKVSEKKYEYTIEGLTADHDYHVRAYAINERDTVYGNDVFFTTNKRETLFLTHDVT